MEKKPCVMVNSVHGKMGRMVAMEVLRRSQEYDMITTSLVGAEVMQPAEILGFHDSGFGITYIKPDKHEMALQAIVDYCHGRGCELYVIDFTHPSAVEAMIDLYLKYDVPFVMGTTGGNRERLKGRTGTPAIVAPNMAKPIAGLMAMFGWATQNMPGLFDGFELVIDESHQAGKADPSGTAKALSALFQKMGAQEIDFNCERNPARQKHLWNIPEENLGGHGHHYYTLVNKDLGVEIQLAHNINGRNVYLDGTFVALDRLIELRREGHGGFYDMSDVIKARPNRPAISRVAE